MPQPTAEQSQAVRRFGTGQTLKITAFAGAGKTTTLQLLAQSRPDHGLYLAFNRSIADQAAEKFPQGTTCSTTHAVAWQALSDRFSEAKLLQKPRPQQIVVELGLEERVFGQHICLTGTQQGYLITRTVENYCYSAEEIILPSHMPRYGRLYGATEAELGAVTTWVITNARMLWGKMIDASDRTPLGHTGYQKLWALGNPKLSCNYVLLDEAQDTNEVVLGVLAEQQVQMVYVGDKHQQIYEWRGAVNAMERFRNCDEVFLTQSFRFGAAIAAEATKVLRTLGETQSIRGNPSIESVIRASGHAETVLARTNATVIREALHAMSADKKAHIVGGTTELKRLLEDVSRLKAGGPGTCPEFFGFTSWADVVSFADTEEGNDIRTFVQLVEQHGDRKLLGAVMFAQRDEIGADVVLSTVHKAKGREWDSVRLAPDFLSSRVTQDHPDAASEVRLFYVAMTRAKTRLIVDPAVLATFTTGSRHTSEHDRTHHTEQTMSATVIPHGGPGSGAPLSPRAVRVRTKRPKKPPSAPPPEQSAPAQSRIPPVQSAPVVPRFAQNSTDQTSIQLGLTILENRLGKDHPRTREAAQLFAARKRATR